MFLANEGLRLPLGSCGKVVPDHNGCARLSAFPADRCAEPLDGIRPVFVLDEDEFARRHIADILASLGLQSVGFGCPFAFFEYLRTHTGSCLVLETKFQFLSGLEVQRHLLSIGKRLPIIFTTDHADVRMVVSAVKAGAIDFLNKPVPADALIDAVSMAFVREHDQREEEHALINLSLRFETLTLRERQVMELVTSGKRNRQTGAVLGISEITVKIHRGQVMRKMEVSSLAELVRARALLETMPHAGCEIRPVPRASRRELERIICPPEVGVC